MTKASGALIAFLMLVMVAGGSSSAVGASSLTCSQTATDDGFVVEWQHTLGGVDRVVLERRVSDRYWWRGVGDGSSGTFLDGQAPKNASRVAYRAVAKAENGDVLLEVGCEMVTTSVLTCSARKTSVGYEITIDGPLDQYEDFVVRRQVQASGPFYWRERTSDPVVVDTESPTGLATYQVWARSERRIVGFAECLADGTTPGNSCRLLVTEDEARAAVVDPPPIDPVVVQELGGWEHTMGPNGTIYFLMDGAPGDDFVFRFDPATGATVQLVTLGSFNVTHHLDLVDSTGGFYTSYSDQNGGPYGRYFELSGPAGDSAEFVSSDVLGLANRPDGTTVRRLLGVEPAAYEIFNPASGQSTPIAWETGAYLLGVDADGRLVMANAITGEYVIVDLLC